MNLIIILKYFCRNLQYYNFSKGTNYNHSNINNIDMITGKNKLKYYTGLFTKYAHPLFFIQ